MADALFFDSLTHASRRGEWLEDNRFDARLSRLLGEIEQVKPYRACLVNIAGYSDNEELRAIAAEHRELFVPIAGFDPSDHSAAESIEPELARLAEQNFAGIKLHPRLNDYDPLDPRCLQTINDAGRHGLVVFLDTLFRQRTRVVDHPANIIDRIAYACADTKIVLLHGAAGAMLDIYETVRMRANLLLDTSFTLMRYAGSSLDADMRFVFKTLDQRATVGSDFPEYSLRDARQRVADLLRDLPETKRHNILHGNLERFLAPWIERNV
jgi:predicted TIM-barrel fold metal-dependent hydrolase